MTFEVFVKEAEKNIKNYLPAPYSNMGFTIQDINTSRGTYKGLYVSNKKTQATPIVNLDDIYHSSKQAGKSMEEMLRTLADAIVSINQECVLSNEFIAQLEDYATAKQCLVVRFASQIFPKDILSQVPHKMKEDLIFVYYLDLSLIPNDIPAVILVTNKLLHNYGISADQLHANAMENTMEKYPANKYVVPPLPLLMVSNATFSYGAVTIAYPGMLEQLGEEIGSDFYVFPSSVHEILIYPDDKDPNNNTEFTQMVKEINRNKIAPEDRLSDSIYHYCVATKKFESITE